MNFNTPTQPEPKNFADLFLEGLEENARRNSNSDTALNNREPIDTDAEIIFTDLAQRVLVFATSSYSVDLDGEKTTELPEWAQKLVSEYQWRVTDTCGYPTVEAKGLVGHLLTHLANVGALDIPATIIIGDSRDIIIDLIESEEPYVYIPD